MKKALITGITGQDGSYLAELLLEKGYEVHGLVRRNSQYNLMPNLNHILPELHLHFGDMTDAGNLAQIVNSVRPNEVYNLAAQSHVHISFDLPEFTSNTNALGVLRLLEAVKSLHESGHDIKFYQASTSEMFGKVQEVPQNELTPFYPRSPYGVAKLYGYWITVNYRESYNLFACNGILFNHESPRRGENFVTRKITLGLANCIAGKQDCVELGNLDSLRDWGHARDFVEGMWLMIQHYEPNDYVLATGNQHSVRDFCEAAANYYNIKLTWTGHGETEVGHDSKSGRLLFKVNPNFYRPAEVNTLLGDPTRARTVLNWQPKFDLQSLVNDMCEHDYKKVTAS